MPSFSKFAVAAAAVAGVSAAPAKSGFSVEQVANPAWSGPNGRGALLRALEKYGAHERATNVKASAPAAATSPAPPSGSGGSVPAVPGDANDSEYLCSVQVGASNPTTLKLDFDTGSSDLWVFSDQMPQNEQGSHSIYKANAANKIAGSSWKISYGDGSGAAGVVYHDTVNIGGISVTSQGVEAATSASAEFVSGANDGLVGLAFSSINTAKPAQKTFFDNAVAQGLPQSLFAANLKYHATGSYDFGFLDSSKYTGDITYTDVDNSQGFWMFTPTGYAVGSGSVTQASLKGIADTGTTLIMAPDEVVTAYYKQVQGAQNNPQAGGYTFPCSTTPPNFTLQIGNYNAVVPGKYINYSPISAGSSTCFGGIQSDASIGFAIWGDVFLKSQYVVFDQTQSTPRLGFAAQAS